MNTHMPSCHVAHVMLDRLGAMRQVVRACFGRWPGLERTDRPML